MSHKPNQEQQARGTHPTAESRKTDDPFVLQTFFICLVGKPRLIHNLDRFLTDYGRTQPVLRGPVEILLPGPRPQETLTPNNRDSQRKNAKSEPSPDSETLATLKPFVMTGDVSLKSPLMTDFVLWATAFAAFLGLKLVNPSAHRIMLIIRPQQPITDLRISG